MKEEKTKILMNNPVYLGFWRIDNLIDPNTETEQVAALHGLDKMLETIKDLNDQHIVLAGDFNFFFDTSLDSYVGKPTLKKKIYCKIYWILKSLICVYL